MADRIKQVVIVQIAVSLALLVIAIIFNYRALAAIVALGVLLAASISTWLLAQRRSGRLVAILDLGLWAIVLAVVWRWNYDMGMGPGMMLFALPIVGIAYALRQAMSAWWMAGASTVAFVAASWLGQSLPPAFGAPYVDLAVSLALALAGIWGTAALAWLAVRAWQAETERLERDKAAAEGEAADRAGRRLAELDRRAAEQAERLESLGVWSLPAIVVRDRIVVLPLGGYLDEARATQARQALLKAISARRARVALIDVTNLPAVDAAGAAQLKVLAEAGRLLGAEVALVGIGPKLANSLIGSQVDVASLCTHHDLQSGLDWALARVGWRMVPNG